MQGNVFAMDLSRLLEIFASFSPLKFITDWRHENTVREQSRLQAQIEIKRIEGEQLIEVVRLLIAEGHISKETAAKIVRSVLTKESSQDFQHPRGPRVASRSSNPAQLGRAPLKRRKGFLR
jgi:hypothetical protein